MELEINRRYWNNGQIKAEISVNSKGLSQGLATYYHSDGTLQARFTINNGDMNGLYQYWQFRQFHIQQHKDNRQHGPSLKFKYR